MAVARFEDGTAPAQVDALIHYADREAALEVVADHDPNYNKQQDALRRTKDQIEVSGLRKSWMVLLSRRANINRVKAALPELLLAFKTTRLHAATATTLGRAIGARPARRHESSADGPQQRVRSRLACSPSLGWVRRHRAHHWRMGDESPSQGSRCSGEARRPS